MTETKFFYWMMWNDEKGRMFVHDPNEVGQVSGSPSEARTQHKAACRFGWVRDGMFDPAVSDLFVKAQGRQVAVQDGAVMEELVNNGALESRVSVYEQRLMG
jgi:hypothetical protein